MTKLETAIKRIIEGSAVQITEEDAMFFIYSLPGPFGIYNLAKSFELLDENGSSEDFAIEFMTAYNKLYPGTY